MNEFEHELDDVDVELDAEGDDSGWAHRLGQFVGMLVAIPLLLVFAALVIAFMALLVGGIGMLAWAVYHADPGEIAPDEDAGWIQLMISNR